MGGPLPWFASIDAKHLLDVYCVPGTQTSHLHHLISTALHGVDSNYRPQFIKQGNEPVEVTVRKKRCAESLLIYLKTGISSGLRI